MDSPVKLLWTGGWDSTFRLLQLVLVEKQSVQPIYVIDRSRQSRWKELEVMDTIIDMINERKPPEVSLHPRKIFVRYDYPDIRELKERYESLSSRMRVGSQYYWLAVVAEMEHLYGAELCMPKHELPSGVQEAVFEGLETESPMLKNTWEAELFSFWTFPSLTITKEDMRVFAKQHGFMDILANRWFCFKPVDGKACAECRPCQIAIEDGVTDGVSFISPPYRLWSAVKRKIRRGLKKIYRVLFYNFKRIN